MEASAVRVTREAQRLESDDRRVITRYLDFRSPRRIRSILNRIMALPDEQVERKLSEVMNNFSARHRDIRAALMDNYQNVARQVRLEQAPSEPRQLLIGAYFTFEYSIESAALFNPSIVVHPDQSGLPAGSMRFLLSLRATGEGHVSSIVFRRGVIDTEGGITFDPPPRYAYSTKPHPDRPFQKELFRRQLGELGAYESMDTTVLGLLPDTFSSRQLRQAVNEARRHAGTRPGFRAMAADMVWLAEANYELSFPSDCLPAEIVIFPATEYERQGMEDLRLVTFHHEDGTARYCGTYTAYNGSRMLPMLLETSDFVTFHVRTLSGRYVRNKGMALFPRRVDGRYMMISRHDGESLYLLRSDSIYTWNHARTLQRPREPWELVQIGNCGSPLETDAGWLLLTHGVGPMRQYCIGAMLLDRDDPARVVGRLREPLLVPSFEEREGYVPNVVYSCGSIIHNERLIIPYAMSDLATAFATVSVPELLGQLLHDGS